MKRSGQCVLSDIVKRRFVLPLGLLHAILDMLKGMAPDRAIAGRTAKQAGLKTFRVDHASKTIASAIVGGVGVDRESDQVP
jgi:hypothetical protein